MDRRRAAGLLLALAACIATATAAPTSSNHTSLDLYDGAPDGCYYNFQHYGEGDRIMTNEPCLNCTCHNRMLMCYLRVCPFTKPIGQDCTVEKRADQCCPIVTCPDVPVDLLTSTTTSPAEYGSTGLGKLDKYGCSMNGKFFPEGAKVPPTPNKPCEHCYCIRNMTTCVMQECTLHVDGCTPIYHKDTCCPVRYSCDHPEDELLALDDLSTTVRPTPGFLLTTTTISPVTQISQDCVYDNRIFADGALIETEKACDHCYCMKGDIVCVVQACGTPMENEGKNCTALPPREGVCCPDTYICEGDEPTTGTYEYEVTTHITREESTTLSAPKRTISEGSGYRSEPDEVPSTKLPMYEPEIEGSGEEEPAIASSITPGSSTSRLPDILATTEDAHEFIPLTTGKPTDDETTSLTGLKEGDNIETDDKKIPESEKLSTTPASQYEHKDEKLTTEKTDVEDIGSGEKPVDDGSVPPKEITLTPSLHTTEETVVTTERNEQYFVTETAAEQEHSKPVTSAPHVEDIKIDGHDAVTDDMATIDMEKKSTPKLPFETVTAATGSSSEYITETSLSTEQKIIPEESTTAGPESLATTSRIESDDANNRNSTNQDITSKPSDENNLETHHYQTSTSVPTFDDEFVTTESQVQSQYDETVKSTEYLEPEQHITASTPMLEEIEKDTTEYIDQHIVPIDDSQYDKSYTLGPATSIIPPKDTEEKEITESSDSETHVTQDNVPTSTNVPVYDQPDTITTEPSNIPEIDTESNAVSLDSEPYSTSIRTPTIDDNGRRTTQQDLPIIITEDKTKPYDSGSSSSYPETEYEGATTEPDKGLNTIPAEEEDLISSGINKTTIYDELMTTESDLDNKFNLEPVTITTLSKPTTLPPDTSVSREETSSFTTESAFNKELDSSTTRQVSLDFTTLAAGITEEVEDVSSSVAHEPKGTESTPDQVERKTTLEPQYAENAETTSLPKETTSPTIYDPSTESLLTTEEEVILKVDVSTQRPETTTVNQGDNEISNEPRIPGEGDCLLNGVTYSNESAVPSSNKCQSGCKCISSIIKCDPIICSPPPEYMNNCETMYDSPDACCPTYICDHKTETKPPQSHNQMSGTEAPLSLPVHCHGDECELSKDKKDNEMPSENCKSGNCDGLFDGSQTVNEPTSPETIPEKSTSHQKEECTYGSDCQPSSVQPCESESCKQEPDKKPAPCANGEDCTADIPIEKCGSNGCIDISSEPKKECNQDNCGESDGFTQEKDHKDCSEPGCKQSAKDTVTSTVSDLQQTSQDDIKEHSPTEMDKTQEIITPAEQLPTHAYEVPETTEHQDFVTKESETITGDMLTTIAEDMELVTKSESFIETSTKLHETDFMPSEEKTTDIPQESVTKVVTTSVENLVPDDTTKTISEASFTETPVAYTSESLETTKFVNIEDDDAGKEFTKVPTESSETDISKSEETTKAPKTHPTALPADTPESPVIEETTLSSSDKHSTEPPPKFIDVYDEITQVESSTEQPISSIPHETKTQDKIESTEPIYSTSSEESSTDPSRRFTINEQGLTKSTIEVVHDVTTTKMPDAYETETSKPFVTEPQRVSEEIITLTTKISDEIVTEPPKVTEHHEVTKSHEEKGDESTTINIVDEFNTKPSVILENEPEQTSKLPEEIDEKTITTPVPLPPISENIEPSVTTIKAIDELSTEPTLSTEAERQPEAEDGVPDHTESQKEIEPSKPSPPTIEFNTDRPNKEEKSTEGPATTETYIPESSGSTIPTMVSDSKIIEQQHDKTTVPGQLHIDSKPEHQDTQKPISDVHTATSPTAERKETSQTDSYKTTQSSEKPIVTEQEVQGQTDIENEISEPSDELRTTSSGLQEFTTSMPSETTKPLHEVDYSEDNTTPQAESQTEKLLPMSDKEEAEESKKPVDDITEPHKTEQYDITTESESDFEKYKTPSSDITQSLEQGIDKEKEYLPTPSSETHTTLFSDHTDTFELVTSTEHAKTTEGKVSFEITTLKEHLIEETPAISQETEPERTTLTSSILDHKVTTERPEVTTEAISLDAAVTETSDLIETGDSLTGLHENPEESASKVTDMETKYETSPVTESDYTKLDQEVTKAPASEISTQEHTEQPQPDSVAEIHYPTDVISDLDIEKPVTMDKNTDEIIEHNKPQPDTTPLESASATESTQPLETSTASKDESSHQSLDLDHTEKITTGSLTTKSSDIVSTPHDVITEMHETTSSDIKDVPETSTHPSVPIEREESTTFASDISQTAEVTTPKEEQSIAVDLSTSEPIESISAQTERTIPSSDKPVEEITGPEQEFILATSKATTVLVDENVTSSPSSEKLTDPTEKPEESTSVIHETPVTTTISTSITTTPHVPYTTGPGVSDIKTSTGPEELITQAYEVPITSAPVDTVTSESLITSAPEVPITVLPEVYSTPAPETTITSQPKESVTALSEAPNEAVPEKSTSESTAPTITASSEEQSKHTPEAPITSKPETLITTSPEAPSKAIPEAPISSAPEVPTTILSEAPSTIVTEMPLSSMPEESSTPALEAIITSAPEAPITASPEAFSTSVAEESVTSVPKKTITDMPEAPSTPGPETLITFAPEAPVTSSFDAPSTSASEASKTSAPEAYITESSEAPSTTAPKASDTSAPETPAIVSSESASTSAPETSEAPKGPKAPEVSEAHITAVPEPPSTPEPEASETSVPEIPVVASSEAPSTLEPEAPYTSVPEVPVIVSSEAPSTSAPETPDTPKAPEATESSEAPEVHEVPVTAAPIPPSTAEPEASGTPVPEIPVIASSEAPSTLEPEAPYTSVPETPAIPSSKAPSTSAPKAPEAPITVAFEAPSTPASEASDTTVHEEPLIASSEAPNTHEPEAPDTSAPEEPIKSTSEILSTPEPQDIVTSSPKVPIIPLFEAVSTLAPEAPDKSAPEAHIGTSPGASSTSEPEVSSPYVPESTTILSAESPTTPAPETFVTSAHKVPTTAMPEISSTSAPETPITTAPEILVTVLPEAPAIDITEIPVKSAPEAPSTAEPETPTKSVPESPITSPAPVTTASISKESEAPEVPTSAPELPKPVSTEAPPTDEVPIDEEASFPTSGTSGYGHEPDYVDEDQTFGPGTCRYGGKVYVSAQQIPRDDPCDFCFCFRSDIICLQQSCPPPIHGCHEEPIQGFCCPRYECPVSMATTVNVTTTTTTTTTTLPPHFPTHSYKGSVQKRGCQIKGQTYKVGDVVRASSGPCLHCTCGGDGQMKCDPKVCTPEPMLRQMIAAAVSTKRRR